MKYPQQIKCDSPFRTAYGPKLKISLTSTAVSRTKQSFKAECDINNIMARYQKTGVLDFTQKNEPRYGDVTGFEFQRAMLTIAQSKSMFAEMPSALRARFKNDPREFLEYIHDPRNVEEAQELGLLTIRKDDPAAPEMKPEGEPKGDPKGESGERKSPKKGDKDQ